MDLLQFISSFPSCFTWATRVIVDDWRAQDADKHGGTETECRALYE